MRKIQTHFFMIFWMLPALIFGGCAQSDEEQIRSSLSAELDSYKNQDASVIESLSAGLDAQAFEQYGLDPEQFIQIYLEGFDYAIDSVQIEEDTALVSVTITCKSIQDYTSRLAAASTELIEDETIQDQDTMSEKIGEAVLESMKQADVSQKEAILLTYIKSNQNWVLSEADNEKLMEALASS